MRSGALEPYERALAAGSPLDLVGSGGGAAPVALDITRFAGPADAADRTVLDRARPPVLDLGCGPGRLLAELTARGVPALGLDVSATAVRMARARGGDALQVGVFGDVPGAGSWGTVLLIDGNIGIDGDPVALLHRAAELAAPGGEVLVETARTPGPDGPFRFADDRGTHGAEFGWSVVTDAALGAVAARAGLRVAERWRAGHRCFAALVADPTGCR